MPLPAPCVQALREHRQRQADRKKAAGDAWRDRQRLVSSRYVTPIDPRGLNRAFAVRCLAADVPVITVHSTRRTCASLLVALDVHPRVAMQIRRHSQIAVTMNVYSEVSPKETGEALRRLGEEAGEVDGAR